MVAGPYTVVQILPELNAGGVERGTLEMGAFLTARGHRSVVISEGGRLVAALEDEGSRHIAWAVGRKTPAAFRYVFSLRRLLVREHVDILHLRSRMPAWVAYAAWKSLPSGSRPRLVTTFHGFYSVNRYSAIMTKGERVIAISRPVADHITDCYRIPEDRVVTIHRGVDERVFDPDSVDEERIRRLKRQWAVDETTAPILMLPGRLTRLKGHDVFIESLAGIETTPWTAVCVGDVAENKPYADFIRKLIREKGLENRVKLVGHCDDMPAALALSDIVISATSTHAEAFGRVAVEAQAMEKPVIATAHGGSLETVIDGKTGWLVKPGDPKALSEAVLEAISSSDLRRRYGRHGRKWVRDNFTVRKMCEKTLEVYSELLGERSC